jgi:hypothetical protein
VPVRDGGFGESCIGATSSRARASCETCLGFEVVRRVTSSHHVRCRELRRRCREHRGVRGLDVFRDDTNNMRRPVLEGGYHHACHHSPAKLLLSRRARFRDAAFSRCSLLSRARRQQMSRASLYVKQRARHSSGEGDALASSSAGQPQLRGRQRLHDKSVTTRDIHRVSVLAHPEDPDDRCSLEDQGICARCGGSNRWQLGLFKRKR